MVYGKIVESPLGALGLTFNEAGALTALGWARLPEGAKDVAGNAVVAVASSKVEAWLEAYFDKQFLPIDFEVEPMGTPYQMSVWKALMDVPCGYTASYKDIALKIASGARAVGTANGRNPLPLIIPCHRIVAADGTLGGYSGGTSTLPALEMKRWLLSHEGALRLTR